MSWSECNGMNCHNHEYKRKNGKLVCSECGQTASNEDVIPESNIIEEKNQKVRW